MMKRVYETPDLLFLYLEETDLIATSYLGDEEEEEEEDDGYTKRY
jgi:hypothetical protein